MQGTGTAVHVHKLESPASDATRPSAPSVASRGRVIYYYPPPTLCAGQNSSCHCIVKKPSLKLSAALANTGRARRPPSPVGSCCNVATLI